MQVGSRVQVVKSEALSKLKLNDLIGAIGTIEEDLTNSRRHNVGYIVNLDKEYLYEKSWYIPEQSIVRE